MGYQNREIEKKFVVEGTSDLKAVEDVLVEIYKNKNIERIEGASNDVYWNPSEKSTCDFVRVRYAANKNDKPELTIKKKDKGYNLNRVEIDLNIDNADNGVKLMEFVLGKPAGSIFKTYVVLLLNKMEESVSIYKVSGDDRVFLEIEARTKDKVDNFEKQLKLGLESHKYNLKRVYKNLYELFIKKELI